MKKPIEFPAFNAPTVDVQRRYSLPSEVRFCKRCVISNQRPRIKFDDEGVCSACRFSEWKRTHIDWERREAELRKLCDRFRRGDGRFDVIVPCSGGKDSGYVSHVLKTRYGMQPLTVTWAPHWYTDIGRENLESLIHSGLDNICFTPNGEVHRIMTRLTFADLGDPFQPFIYGQKNFPMMMATLYNVPLVMFGENGEVEYGGDMKNAASPTHDNDEDIMRNYFSDVSPAEWARCGVSLHDLQVYMGPPREQVERIGVECHFMGYYHKWTPQEIYYYAVDHTGFQANPDGRSEGTYSKYASLDDRLDGFHYYLAYIKFGLGRATSDAAHEIRDGHITRDEGVALVKQFDGEFPRKYYKDFLSYTGLDETQFNAVIDAWRSPHLWQRTDGGWQLKRTVWQSGAEQPSRQSA